MKIPVAYELNGRRRFLLVQDGETISIGRGETCSIRVDGEEVKEVELTAQLVNSCQFVVVTPSNGAVPYVQPLPWKLPLSGAELELFRPATGGKDAGGSAGREMVLQGLSTGETRVVMKAGQPLLLGASADCDVVISDDGCPAVLLALWTAGSKMLVQVLDNGCVVGWLGRGGESEAELDLPLSLSLISAGDAPAVKAPVLASLPKVPGIQAKNLDGAPKIVSRQAKPADSKNDAGPPARTSSEPSAKPMVHAAMFASSPVPLPRHLGNAANEDAALLAEPVVDAAKPYSPTIFMLFSWLLMALTFAIAFLPQQGVLTPEQIMQLWYAAGGTLILTLVLGLGVLLK
jgi:hypothetical protein